jgi:hypothetical protein
MFGPYIQDNRKLGMVYTPLGAILQGGHIKDFQSIVGQ